MSVDILAIGENRKNRINNQDVIPSISVNPWQRDREQETQISPLTKAQQTLNRQVEIGLGTKITPMSQMEKQKYADGLSENKRNLMQLYKAEGYSFEASKKLVDQQKELANPTARGTDKYKDYLSKEQYYNNTGGTVDPDSTLYKIGTFLQKIGFNEEEKNPLNKLAQDYMEWYSKEREAVDTVMEDKEANLLEKFGRWLQKSLMSAEAGVISGLGKIGNAVSGVEDINQSALNATLDRAILGYDTDLNYYRTDDRRLDEYLWEGASGGLTTLFRARAPKVMAAFTALGETKPGEWTLEKADNLVRGAIKLGLQIPGLKQYYNGLDESGQEDMLDALTTLTYMKISKMTGKWTGKLKTTKAGIEYDNIKNQFKTALNRGIEGAKEQAKAEVNNVKEATDLYDESGKKVGSMGPEGETGIGRSWNRIVTRGIDEFKQSYIDRYNARHGGKVAEPGEVVETEPVTAEPNQNKQEGAIEKAKNVVTDTWNNMVTGLTPEERVRIQNDPYVSEKFNKAMGMIQEAGMPLEESFITEQLYNEVGDKIIQTFEEWENKLSETSPYYKGLRELTNTYSLVESLPELSNLLLSNDIATDPFTGELDFGNSKFVSDADMRSVQRAVDMVKNAVIAPMTPRDYLNLRAKLDQLAKYTTVDASRGQSLIRKIRHAVDNIAKKTIPGLKEIDDTTSKYFKEISELKDGWIYKGGDRKGEIRNNFYSIIKNLTGHNRKVMLQRLEKYYPGIAEEIEAIHLTAKLVKAYNKSPQIIKAMGIGGGIAGGVMGGSIIKGMLGALIGELVQEGIIRPMTKSFRKKAIEKLLSDMSPEAKAKLEEIALKQTYAKEMSAEDQKILERVAEIIANERDRGLSEAAIREREKRTKGSNQKALPGVQPDVVDENGNITLGRGNVISPEKGPGRAKRVTKVNEINLYKPETTPSTRALDIQEELGVTPSVAEDIQSTVDDFLAEIGASEEGTIGGREVNYEKFSTPSLEELLKDDNIPQTEKDKIQETLATREKETIKREATELDREYAYRINKLSEEEQRIGKVGRNKVSKEVADRQMRAWEKKREKLTERMMEDYGIDQFQASDKYAELEGKGIDFINSYTKTDKFREENAERMVLNSLKEGWSKQPKFLRDMTAWQLGQRQEIINNVELQNGYRLETTNYNDRYILEENGSIVDRGAIKYMDDGTIEITAQSFDGVKESGLLEYLPDNTLIKESGSDTWMSVKELKQYPKADRFWLKDNEGVLRPASKLQQYYDFEDKNPIEKFTGELTEEQKQEGLDLYELAKEPLSKETEKDIIEARGKFLVLNQKPGYTKSLGLDQGEVNQTIMSWQRMSPELKEFVDKIHAKTDPKYWFMGISNWIERDNPWRGTDALKFLTDEVKGVDKDPAEKSYDLEIRSTLDGIMLGNSKLSYDTLKIRLTHGEEMNAFNLELRKQEAIGEYFPDIDMLVAGEGTETVTHEEGHYISTLIGREMLGTDRKFDKGIRYATSDTRKRLSPERYKSPEVEEFHQKILDLVKSLDKSMAHWMRSDTSIAGGRQGKDYRADSDEKRARFRQGSIAFTKRIAQTGKLPAKTYTSEHGDRYTLKQYEQLIDILQEHQRLADAGLFYEVEVPDPSGENRRTGLKDIQQKSLFDADNPLNDYQMKDYSEINNAISDLYDIAHPIARDNNYAWDAFLRQLGNTYSSNMETWKEGLKAEGIKVSDQDLVRMYRGVLKTMNNPRNEFIFRASGYNPVMTGLSKLIDKIKIDPLDIPQEYGMMAEVIKQQDRSPLERYLEKHPGDIDELRKTYDPDVVEWRNNLASRGTNTEDLSLTRLYEIKNMLDEYIKTHPEDAEIEGTIDNTGIKFLVDKARYREKNNGEIGTYDKKQIKKVAEETEDLIKNRLDDLIRLIAIDPDYQGNVGRIEDNISIDFIGELANTYDPDVDKWQKSISKKIKELYEKTRDHVKISDKEINKLIKPHQLTGLKAKILELEKYSAEQIQDVYDGTFTEIFFRLVKSRIDKLKAKGAEKAVTNLVAIHNINENNLKKIIKDFEGKDPMPSIAVMDVNVPHEVFGDISLVFGRDTVDPKVNPENKMYASDAWTPTFPTLKYETIWNGIEEEEGRVRNLVATVQRSLDKGAASKDIQPEIIENIILDRIPNARKGEQIYIGDVAGRMVDVIRIIAKEEGKKMETEEYLRRYNELLDLLEPGMQEISKIPASYFSNGRKKSENVQKMAEEMASYIANDPAASSDILDFENEGELEDYIEKIINKRRGGGTEKIIDTLEMELGVNGDELREIVDKYFLPSGDQPTTPENILKAMKNQKLNRQTYPGEYEDMIEIEGTNLNDIEDVRRQNFAKVFHGDRTGDLGDLKKRYDRLVDIAARDIMGVDDYEAADTWKILKQEIKWNYDPKLETFKENLVEENSMWESVPDEVLQRIIDVVEQGKRIPIRFSESKPERIVNLMEEVQYILVPEGKQTDAVNEIVKGTPLEGKVQSYKPDNYSAPRSKKLKELQKKYGNVFFSMGGLTMPIAMLYLMMQQENEG